MEQGHILVTGGAGYIGSHAILGLLDNGYKVVTVDDLSSGLAWAVDPRCDLIVADVADQPKMRSVLQGYNVQAILHFAGSVSVPESMSDPLKYYRNNLAASASLIDSAIRENVPHFIFSSTASVYGIVDVTPIHESTPTRPINAYGMSKLMTEQVLQDATAAHPFNFAALRYFNVAGADPQGRAGQSSPGATHLIKVAVDTILGKRSCLEIYGTDYPTADGTCIRDYIHVTDLVDAHLAALKLLQSQPKESHILNIGYGRGRSVFEVLDSVEHVCGTNIDKRLASRREGDPPTLVADSEAAKEILNWTPKLDDLDVIIQHALRWQSELAADECMPLAPHSRP